MAQFDRSTVVLWPVGEYCPCMANFTREVQPDGSLNLPHLRFIEVAYVRTLVFPSAELITALDAIELPFCTKSRAIPQIRVPVVTIQRTIAV